MVICIKMFRLVFIVYFASLSSHHTLRFQFYVLILFILGLLKQTKTQRYSLLRKQNQIRISNIADQRGTFRLRPVVGREKDRRGNRLRT